MVAFTALLLFVIGLLNLYKFSVRWDKFVCGTSFFALLILVFRFADQMLEIKEHTFSFLWNSSPSGDIKFDIISNTYNCELFLTFLLIGFLAVGANYCFRYEEKRCRYNAIIFFDLTALLLMITSNNFVQLLSTLFLIDVFCVAGANNTNACRSFIIVNLIADMLIFMVLALINSRVDSLDIRQIINYKNMGYHLNFIAIVGFTAILMKMSFLPFQTSLLSLDAIRAHRLQNILCLFSPASALILLLKFSILWLSSDYFLVFFDAACLSSIIWCALRSAIAINLKTKMIYWQIMFFGILLELLRFHGFIWDWRFSDLLLANYVLICGIYLIYYHTGRKNNLLLIMKQKYQSRKGIWVGFIIITSAIISQINIMEMLYNNRNRYYIWTYAALFLLSFCGVLHQILFMEHRDVADFNKVKPNPHQPMFLLLLGTVCTLLLVQLNWESIIFWSMFGIYIALVLSGISAYTAQFYNCETLQEIDLFKRFYYNFFVGILQNLGRLLWLVIDWKLVEKIITGTFLGIWQTGLRLFKSIQTNFRRRFLFILLVLYVLFWLSPYFSGVWR